MFSLAVKHFIFAFKKSSGIPDLKQAGKKPVPNAGTMSDREEDVPECSGQEISRIFSEKNKTREMAFGNAYL